MRFVYKQLICAVADPERSGWNPSLCPRLGSPFGNSWIRPNSDVGLWIKKSNKGQIKHQARSCRALTPLQKLNSWRFHQNQWKNMKKIEGNLIYVIYFFSDVNERKIKEVMQIKWDFVKQFCLMQSCWYKESGRILFRFTEKPTADKTSKCRIDVMDEVQSNQ